MSRTPLFRGFGKGTFWKYGTAIEVFKFSLYLILPVSTAVIYNNPELMNKIITKLKYIEYPKPEPVDYVAVRKYEEQKQRSEDIDRLEREFEEQQAQKRAQLAAHAKANK